MASVKNEGEAGPGASIKTDPEFANDAIAALPDEDIYEDAGDIDFTDASQKMYLMRLPRWLWKTWSELEDDAEIQLGTVRVEGELDNPKRLSLKLDSQERHSLVPKEYNMNITNEKPQNMFVFTEKDFAGFGTRSRGKAQYGADAASRPFSQAEPRFYMHNRQRPGSAKVEKTERPKYRGRRAIPKKTAFAGQVKTELSCMPVENEDYRRVMEERARREYKAPRQPKLLGGPVGVMVGNAMAPSTIGNPGSFNTFIKTAPPRTKGQDLKTARMPQNELLDLLFKCFTQFTHWPLKSIKAQVQQPEAYLRQTLEMIAEMVKSGTFAGTWKLRKDANVAEYSGSGLDFGQAQEGKAPDGGLGMDGASDVGDLDKSEDEDDIKMEDVPL